LGVGRGAGERVDPFVFGVAVVGLDPMPLHTMRFDGFN
jgi:hypothetical protein